MGVTAVPFPTAVLAQSLGQPGGTVAAALYSGTYVLIAVAFNVLWRYASHHHRLLHTNADRQAVQAITSA